MYRVYLDKTLLPVAPEKIKLRIRGRNETVTLINESEVNLIKTAGLSEISFDARLPQMQYPFADYPDGYRDGESYLDRFEEIMNAKKPVRLIITRTTPGGKVLFGTNMRVSLEDYTVQEDVKDGFDQTVSPSLKQYRDYGTKTVAVDPIRQRVLSDAEQRETENAPSAKTYTVKKGDCLWMIAQAQMGDGNRYPELYEANKTVIDGKNKGTGNPRYTIYPGQVLTIPEKAG